MAVAFHRRYLIVALLITLGLILAVYSSPHAREKASILSTKYNVPWFSSPSSSSSPSSPSSYAEPSEFPEDELPPLPVDATTPNSNRPTGDLFPGSSASLYRETAITETHLPLQEAGVAHTYGFTYFERLYVWNGTIYAVMSKERQSIFPELKHVISVPQDRGKGFNLEPTDTEMQVITPEEAKDILGARAAVIEGTSFLFYDTKQYMAHYYHWWGEIILGAMRVYSAVSLLPKSAHTSSLGGSTHMPDPDRFILPHVFDQGWRDRAGVDGPLMRAAFPSAAIERRDFWEDLLLVEQPFVLERGMLVNRNAAHKSPLTAQWAKMIGTTMALDPAPHFWEPIRQRVIPNLVGYLPIQDESGRVVEPSPSTSASHPTDADTDTEAHPDPSTLGSHRPLVLYISRQNHGRRLTNASNDDLEASMRRVCDDEGLCEFQVAHMEDWALKAQIEAVGRAVVMLGVHGNGLTHQIWMPPSKRSTLIEIFYPETYLHDYSMLARNVGHKHYAIWNDTYLTFEDGKTFDGVRGGSRDNFHGNSIPVYGPTVADIVRKRLNEP